MARGSGGMVPEGATRTGRAAVLIVVAAVVAIVLLNHSPSTPAVTASKTKPTTSTTVAGGQPGGSTATTSTSTSTTTVASTVPAVQVKVLVLNGASFTEPLAGDYTTKVKDDGYTTLTPENASATVASSVIYVMTTGYAPEADALAAKLGLTSSAVQTTVPTGSPLPSYVKTSGANLVLVVGPDLAAQVSKS